MNKIDEKTRRLYFWMLGKPQPPYTIELVPTNKCNFNCSSCWRQSVSKEEINKTYADEMSDERLLELINEAAEIGVKEIAFVGGGEPLARDITSTLMKKIGNQGMEGDLVTNGSMLTQEIIQNLVDIQWTRVKFSIDGSCAELQDKLRGNECFNQIIDNIKRLSAEKTKKNSKLPKIGFNVVISNLNYKDLPNIVELAYDVGCNEILLLPMTIFSEKGKNLKMHLNQMKEFQHIIQSCLPKLLKYHIFSNMDKFLDIRYLDKTNEMHTILMEEANMEKKHGGQTMIKNDEENFITVPCFEPWSHVTILPNGNVACCFNNYVWETKVSLKNNTLEELWYGDYFNIFREEVLTRKLSNACATCCVWRVFETKSIREKLRNFLDDSFLSKLKLGLQHV